MSKLILGQLANNLPEGHRDAVHVCCARVTCVFAHRVYPACSVRFTSRNIVEPCTELERHAIVDPFLKVSPVDNEAFLVLIEPHMVSGLRHHFDIDQEKPRIKVIDPTPAESGLADPEFGDDGECRSMGCDPDS